MSCSEGAQPPEVLSARGPQSAFVPIAFVRSRVSTLGVGRSGFVVFGFAALSGLICGAPLQAQPAAQEPATQEPSEDAAAASCELPGKPNRPLAWVKEGRRRRRRGDDAGALACFRRAHAVEATPEVKARMAMCEQALGDWLSAESHLREALATPDRFIRRYREPLEAALRTIETHLGALMLVGGKAGAQVEAGGAPLPPLPWTEPVRVVSGAVKVSVEAEGHERWERTLRVPSGSTLERRVVLRAMPPPSPPASAKVTPAPAPEPADRTASDWMLGLGLGGAGAAVVGAGIGVGFMIDRESKARRLNSDACTPSQPGQPVSEVPGCSAAHRGAKRAETAGLVAFVASGVLASASAVLLALALAGQDDSADPQAASATCAFSPLGLSLGCSGRF